MIKRILVAVFLIGASVGGLAAAGATEVTVYKSPTCGCCEKWIEHLRANGFSVKAQNVEDVTPYKIRYGVTPELASCHTAVVDGYVIEGHVPAQDIKRLLRERPRVLGLSAPGMPSGAPGMDGAAQHYNVVSFDRQGNVAVYAAH